MGRPLCQQSARLPPFNGRATLPAECEASPVLWVGHFATGALPQAPTRRWSRLGCTSPCVGVMRSRRRVQVALVRQGAVAHGEEGWPASRRRPGSSGLCRSHHAPVSALMQIPPCSGLCRSPWMLRSMHIPHA